MFFFSSTACLAIRLSFFVSREVFFILNLQDILTFERKTDDCPRVFYQNHAFFCNCPRVFYQNHAIFSNCPQVFYQNYAISVHLPRVFYQNYAIFCNCLRVFCLNYAISVHLPQVFCQNHAFFCDCPRVFERFLPNSDNLPPFLSRFLRILIIYTRS